MQVNKALNTDLQPLRTTDSVSAARERMDTFDVRTWPVVNSATQKLIGQIHSDQLSDGVAGDLSIAALEMDEAIKLYETQHIFEAARLMFQHELEILPVVNGEWIYVGMIRKKRLLEALADMLNLTRYGAVITIELGKVDFTLSEIVHLIEVEGAKILGITVEMPDADKNSYQVSIKLNLGDVSRVASSLRRYGYSVITDSGVEVLGPDLETRADELIKYLDM